jgi:hypothetical protein
VLFSQLSARVVPEGLVLIRLAFAVSCAAAARAGRGPVDVYHDVEMYRNESVNNVVDSSRAVRVNPLHDYDDVSL